MHVKETGAIGRRQDAVLIPKQRGAQRALQFLVPALLDAQVAYQRGPVHDLPPRQDAAAITEGADGEAHGADTA